MSESNKQVLADLVQRKEKALEVIRNKEKILLLPNVQRNPVAVQHHTKALTEAKNDYNTALQEIKAHLSIK